MLFIFDMGGVLLHNVFELVTILREKGINTPPSEMYKDSLMYDFSAGLITEDEYWKQFNRRYNTNVSSPRWGRTFHPVRDGKMESYIRELGKDHRVVCGTNTFDAHWKISMERGDYALFDRVYASHLMGWAKPSPEFWKVILKEEQRRPDETVFIDDFSENIKAARSVGINAVHYRDLDTLKAEIGSIIDSRSDTCRV